MKCVLCQFAIAWSVCWCFLCVSAREAQAQDAATRLSVGVAAVDINAATRVTAPDDQPRVRAKAIVLAQGDTRAALVFCDVLWMPRRVTEPARRQAHVQTGIPIANIAIAATHTHKSRLGQHDVMREKVVEAIAKAHALAKPARLEYGVARQTPPLSFNRRFHMKVGPVRMNPGAHNRNIIRAAGPIDPEVGILMVRDAREGRALASLTVFALHLDTVRRGEHPADYPYYLEQHLRESHGEDFLSLFGTGACGDINHLNVKGRSRNTTEIGTLLARTVAAKTAKLQAVADPSLAVRRAVVEVSLQAKEMDRWKGTPQDLSIIEKGRRPFLKRVYGWKFAKLTRLLEEGPTYRAEVQVFRLSNDLAIVCLPGEVFVELGLAIKKASPFETTMVIELANDAPAYIPTKKAFREGSYETVNSVLEPGSGEKLVAAALTLLEELHQ